MMSFRFMVIAMLAMLALSGCSAQMIAGADDTGEFANMAEGDAFMKANKKKEGVVELFSGIQYKVLKEGTGDTPTSDDTVVFKYKGMNIEGEVFDTSRGQIRVARVGKMMSGIQEAMLRMKEGAKWEVYLPPEFAYGKRSVGSVGPNSTVIYDLELVEIKNKK